MRYKHYPPHVTHVITLPC